MVQVLADLWARVTATQPVPATGVVLATTAAAVALVIVPGLWPVSRHVVTVAHEAGHAVVALLAGRRLSGIRLHSDTSGLTVTRGRPRGPGMVLTLLAGYTGPSALGLGAAALLTAGHAVGVLWAVLLLLAGMLAGIRNLFGLWVVLACGAAVFAMTWWASPGTQSVAGYTLTWFWLLAAPRTVAELAGSRRRTRARTSDADQLATLTHVPAALWVLAFAVVGLGVAALAATWLLPGVLTRG